MKKQTAKSKKDESLGERRGKESTKSQSMASRRHESEGAAHPDHHKKAIMHHMHQLHKMAKHHHKGK